MRDKILDITIYHLHIYSQKIDKRLLTGGIMRSTRIILAMLFILSLSWSMVSCEQGEKTGQMEQEKPSVERISEVVLSAVVEAVDYDARTLTLKDEEGSTQTFQVKNPNVPLEKLVVGNQVTMTIYQKEVNYVAAPGEEIPSDEQLRTVGAKGKDESKNITIVNAQTMTNTVKEIDLANRLLTLVSADGLPLTLPVQDDVKNLDKLEVGDQVVTQITQVISVSIEE
jgi:hypothetical protein